MIENIEAEDLLMYKDKIFNEEFMVESIILDKD
jgi:hypothetical protein